MSIAYSVKLVYIDTMNDIRITLRLPEDLHLLITQTASKEERSLNGQIIYLLKRALELPEKTKPQTDKKT